MEEINTVEKIEFLEKCSFLLYLGSYWRWSNKTISCRR